jgi:S-adenosylmethionine:tRNA ribosyltransferase-isomerase
MSKSTVQNTSMLNFNYDLPEAKIAKYPVEPRDTSKLLIYKDGKIDQAIYSDLSSFLPSDTMLIMNDTKVVEARLIFNKQSGGKIEIFCLEPADHYSDITTAMFQKDLVLWKCMVGGAKKWKEETLILQIETAQKKYTLSATKKERLSDSFLIEFSWDGKDISFAEVLSDAGIVPLPPYLNRDTEEKDKALYQTIYAKYDGSVAAPTAGLHFTDNVMQSLSAKGIQTSFVTLHVGAGTFKPVKTETLGEHEMHSEFIDVSLQTIISIAQHLPKNLIAVGTTSLRTLESLYWMGVKVHTHAQLDLSEIGIQQWDAYDLPQEISVNVALESLVKYMENKNINRLITKTQLLIAPGYTLRMVDAILTNFHQPQSTLLLLIHAFVGEEWKTIYQFALENEYRFLSYGDGSLLWRDY